MASGIYNHFKYLIMRGAMDLTLNTLKCALLTSSASFDATKNQWSEISANEVASTGNYIAGGRTMSGQSVTESDANTNAVFTASNVTWVNSTISAQFACIYDASVSTNDLICLIDFGTTYSSSNGNFTIQWNASGIIVLS
jgi:hypothetical protein